MAIRLSREAVVLLALCTADLVTTIYVVESLGAGEGNPIMGYYLSHSVAAFVCVKAVLCIIPLFILEYARRTHPQLVRWAMRAGIAAYVGMYCCALVPQLDDLRLEVAASHIDMHAIESPSPLFAQMYADSHRRMAIVGPPAQIVSLR
jgi:uncharacterized protein YqgC (DUF456 family)